MPFTFSIQSENATTRVGRWLSSGIKFANFAFQINCCASVYGSRFNCRRMAFVISLRHWPKAGFETARSLLIRVAKKTAFPFFSIYPTHQPMSFPSTRVHPVLDRMTDVAEDSVTITLFSVSILRLENGVFPSYTSTRNCT